jgi:hypothetical protein
VLEREKSVRREKRVSEERKECKREKREDTHTGEG